MYAASNTIYPRLVTGSAGSIEYSVFGTEHSTGPTDLVKPLGQGTVTTATTTTMYQPASGTEAQIRHISITNSHASISNAIEIHAYDGTTNRLMWRGTLNNDETLHWVERDGVWRMYDSDGFIKLFTDSNAGDAFPSSVFHGRPWYRTDLNWLFHYDSDRSNWLGELEVYQFGRNGNTAAGDFLRFGGNVIATSTGSGVLIPYSSTCVGMTCQHNTSPTGGDMILNDGTSHEAHVVLTGSFDYAIDMDLNENIGIDALLNVEWGDFDDILFPSTIIDPIVLVYLRRRAT